MQTVLHSSPPRFYAKRLLLAVAATFALGLASGQAQAQNLIINGDFSAGNTGFTSAYTYNATDLTGEGTYNTGTNPFNYHGLWASFGDHTTGTGNMMILNGSNVPGTNAWTSSLITVTPNTDYYFSAWVTSVYPTSPAILQFSINGTPIGGNFSPTNGTPDWRQFFVAWNSGTATTVDLTILNQNLAPGGNDFALDDIVFSTTAVTGGTNTTAPEPGTIAFMLTSGLPLAGMVIRRLRKS